MMRSIVKVNLRLLFSLPFFIFCLCAVTCSKDDSNINAHNNAGYPTPKTAMPFNDISAAQLVDNIRIGWNLGNTLDALPNWLGPDASVSALETAWGNPAVTKATVEMIKNAGFNTIRIPVSWSKAIDGNYNIRTDWMARVVEVVNYAVDLDMYVILNTHHDEDIFRFMNKDVEESKKAFQKIWQQIAGVFKDYNEKLIFEGLNEPRTRGSAAEWNGGTAEERSNLNDHYKIFVDVVRKSGGNNGKRILMINTYAGSAEAAAINGLVLPHDTTADKLVVSVHAYAPYNFALNTNSPINTWSRDNYADTSAITGPIDRAYNAFVSKGIPVILGEFGAMNKDNEQARADWAEYYVGYALSKGIKCVWWDNGNTDSDGEKFGLFNRRTNSVVFPLIVDALMMCTAE